MTIIGILQIVCFLVLLVLLARPLGSYLARIYQGERTLLDPILRPVERVIYRLGGIDADRELDWRQNALAMLCFNLAGLILIYLLQRIQQFLPLNPQGLGPISPDGAFNAAVSFTTNTNWQWYPGETTMSYCTQMAGMTVQNFVSAGTGLAILVLFIRGIARHSASTLGNFWVDLTRSILYVLFPLSLVLSLVLVSQGTIQNLSGYLSVPMLQPVVGEAGVVVREQVLPMGPAASQVAIKHLGTNGGGFFNANAAHPFESPTPLTDFLLLLSEGVISAALCYTFGRMIGDTRQGWALLAVMLIILIPGILLTYYAEASGNPQLASLGIDQRTTEINPGGNMEGKEARLGIAPSALFATVTTATSSGAVNSMHDSFTPLGGLIPLVMMHLGEVVFGGVGSGLYGMLVFVIVAVFVAGLLVGRTPEYLGRKIEAFEMKMASLLILIMPITVLLFTALAVVTTAGKAGIMNPGPHGFSEILYAFTSQGNNNGSAFAGLAVNTPFYNTTGALAMLIGRFWLAVPTLALAGSLAQKKHVPPGDGTLPTHTPLFVFWLIAVIIIVGALNFLPALALGPIVEHFMMVH
jgi:potassium-transporting ATPase potassium-binding subunit